MAALAAAAGGALSAPAAAVDETPPGQVPGQVNFPTHCLPPQEAGLPPADGPTTVRITVDNPAPQVGDTVTVTYQVIATPAVADPDRSPAGAGLPADAPTPTGRVLLAGAQSGEVTVVGGRRDVPASPASPANPGAALPALTMTGTFTVTAPGEITLAPGGYTLHTSHPVDLDTVCTAAEAPVSVRLTATPLPTANLRSVFLAAPAGAPGARLKVTAAGFTPGATVTVAGRAGAAETADRAVATADELGVALAELPVTDKATTAVVAYEGTAWSARLGSGPAAYTVIGVTPPPPGTQEITATVEPGTLAMTQAGEAITLGAVPYGDGGGAPGRIGTVTVKDARSGPAGWSLIGKVTDFTGPGGLRIPGGSLSWTPTCAAAAGSPSPCTAGSVGTVGPDGAVLASTPDGPLVGGTFTVDAAVTLHVPPYTPPGAYTAVLTLTLS
ncbi:beta-xylosidase [Streptomyces sp. NBC_00868]|uniref:beta-xylosidase n=1 Tax=unclassified Streptomyces TaxID=2593676 RepID=UPI003254B16E|nr:beta-xylosidase [Streptomyces sp. NBC_00868]